MKRIVVVLMLLIGLSVQAQESQKPKSIDFLYIHGAYEEGEDFFKGVVNKMQPEMKKAFEENPTTKEIFLKNGEYTINPEGKYLYWGNDSLENMKTVDVGLDLSKLFSPLIAQITRTQIAHLLHDSIWIQKFHNMKPILKNLNNIVKERYTKDNESFVIFGYSAGTFVAYNYFLYNLKYLDLVPLLTEENATLNAYQKSIIKSVNPKPTCLSAILESEVAFLTMDGSLVPNPSTTKYKENFQKLNGYTDKFCAPDGSVKGAVVFGSPLLIFYSEAPEDTSKLHSLDYLLGQYMIENNIFFIAANYREDPLALPAPGNQKFADIKKHEFYKNMKNGGGFVFDESDIKSGKTVITAHISYWDSPKRFSQAVAKVFEKGYYYFYDLQNPYEAKKK